MPHLSTLCPKGKNPLAPLHPVVTVGPFCKWAIDFMKINPISTNGHKYIVMVVIEDGLDLITGEEMT